MVDRQRLLEAVDLPALADELLGLRKGRGPSASWPCPSPTHAQTGRTPPVSVFPARSGGERWHCFGCGVGGTAVDLVITACGLTPGQALADLARRCGLEAGEPVPPSLRPPQPRSTEAAPGDLEALAAFVEACAARLWRPDGAAVRSWLCGERGLPEPVLRANRVGADPGRDGQARPDGMPAAGEAAVLAVVAGGRAVFAQLRPLRPGPGRPRYLNAARRLAPNPKVARFRPRDAVGRCVIVTEGAIDALSANAAGYRAVAVLGASLAGGVGGAVADHLAGLRAPLVLAFDADDAGRQAAGRLRADLRKRHATVATLHVPEEAKDLNGWLRRSREWPATLTSGVREAVAAIPRARGLCR